mgnify:CR=1 FL=1
MLFGLTSLQCDADKDGFGLLDGVSRALETTPIHVDANFGFLGKSGEIGPGQNKMQCSCTTKIPLCCGSPDSLSMEYDKDYL